MCSEWGPLWECTQKNMQNVTSQTNFNITVRHKTSSFHYYDYTSSYLWLTGLVILLEGSDL